MLAEAVLELYAQGKPFTRENLDASYVRRRRESWVELEGRVAERARDGFQKSVVRGLVGMALSGLSRGAVNLGPEPVPPHERIGTIEGYFAGRIPAGEIARIQKECAERGASVHDALMTRAGWPEIPYDGELLVTHQDALLMGGKVQAPPGYADHVTFTAPELCASCGARTCIEVCSGEAIKPGEGGVPQFDREKCVFCGACLWNCTQPVEPGSERTNLEFRAGAGGLHSAEN
jgi:electron-transferring-flavoprotein dehydrogenase